MGHVCRSVNLGAGAQIAGPRQIFPAPGKAMQRTGRSRGGKTGGRGRPKKASADSAEAYPREAGGDTRDRLGAFKIGVRAAVHGCQSQCTEATAQKRTVGFSFFGTSTSPPGLDVGRIGVAPRDPMGAPGSERSVARCCSRGRATSWAYARESPRGTWRARVAKTRCAATPRTWKSSPPARRGLGRVGSRTPSLTHSNADTSRDAHGSKSPTAPAAACMECGTP
jgi:hypothetical protein